MAGGIRTPPVLTVPSPQPLGAQVGFGTAADVPPPIAIPLVFVSLILQGRENPQQRLRFALRHQVGRQPSVFVAPVHSVEDQHETHHENY